MKVNESIKLDDTVNNVIYIMQYRTNKKSERFGGDVVKLQKWHFRAKQNFTIDLYNFLLFDSHITAPLVWENIKIIFHCILLALSFPWHVVYKVSRFLSKPKEFVFKACSASLRLSAKKKIVCIFFLCHRNHFGMNNFRQYIGDDGTWMKITMSNFITSRWNVDFEKLLFTLWWHDEYKRCDVNYCDF